MKMIANTSRMGLSRINMATRLRGIGVALAICIISAPIAVIITLALLPFWSWIESAFRIESIGHSGPAEWCYLASYFFVLICLSLLWTAKRRKTDNSLQRTKH